MRCANTRLHPPGVCARLGMGAGGRPRRLKGCQARLAAFQPGSQTQQVPAHGPPAASAPRGSRGRSPEPGSQASALGPSSGRNLSRPAPLWGVSWPTGRHWGCWQTGCQKRGPAEGPGGRGEEELRRRRGAPGGRRAQESPVRQSVASAEAPCCNKLPGAVLLQVSGPPSEQPGQRPPPVPRKLGAAEQTHK